MGAALNGGRWNRVGTSVVYAAQSPSLAALEVLVHYSVLPRDFVLTEIAIPENLPILRIEITHLPAGWGGGSISSFTQETGDAWVLAGQFAVMSVPSSVIPWDLNYVLNPAHTDFGKLEFREPVPFRFDPRLK